MHRELGALAHGPGDQPQAQQRAGQRRERTTGVGLGGPDVEILELHRARPGRERHHAHQQQHIAHPLGEEGVAGGRDHQRLGVPEAHQQVGGEGEHLQQEIAHEQAAAENHPGQGPFEEAHQGVEACQRPFLVEVAERIHLSEQAHAGDQLERRQVGEREVEADAQVQIGGAEPGEVQVLGAELPHLLEDPAAVGHGHQRDQQVQVGRRSGPIAFDPARSPRQRQHHAAEPIERDQPDHLDRQG